MTAVDMESDNCSTSGCSVTFCKSQVARAEILLSSWGAWAATFTSDEACMLRLGRFATLSPGFGGPGHCWPLPTNASMWRHAETGKTKTRQVYGSII